MLSRVVNKNLFKSSAAVQRMMRPAQVMTQKRCFQGHLNLDSQWSLVPQDVKQNDQVSLWRDIQASQSNALVLRSNDEIENYVLSLVRNYFRTTRKASVALDSDFAAHGLDSLDVIELVIQVEDELGYLIDAEKLELFSKPRHFVNYIAQLEAYRTEHNRLPHEGIYEDFKVKKHFPGLPSLGH